MCLWLLRVRVSRVMCVRSSCVSVCRKAPLRLLPRCVCANWAHELTLDSGLQAVNKLNSDIAMMAAVRELHEALAKEAIRTRA